MLSAIKFGTAQFLTSNPPSNTVCLALDFDDKKLYMITSEHKVLLSELMTAHLLDENGKIKQKYLDNGSVVEVPTKTSQLENDSGFITKDAKSLKYYLTKDETLAEINKSVVSLTKDMNHNVDYLNTKIEQEVIKLQHQINGLSGSYVYIGKIDNVNPTQDELTQVATQLKGEVKVGYVIVDESQKEWYFDGSVWNDFGTASSEITWDAIQDKPKLVEYTKYPEYDKTASITLTNNNAIFGTDTNGATYNLAMVSKWNKADFGSSSLEFNINSKDAVVTINDDKVIATVDQIPVDENGKLKADALPEEAVTVADIQATLEDYAEKTYVNEKVSTLGTETKEYADEKDLTTLDEAKAFANNKFVEKEITGTLGVAKVWNEVTGGGAMFTRTDGVKSFVGVNQGNSETSRDVNAQIYAIDTNSIGTRLNIYKDGITYAKNLGKGQQDIENHPELELAVKGDVTSGVAEAKTYTDSAIETVNTSLTDILAQIAELKAKIENV